MRIIVEIHENNIGEMLSVEEKINIESYRATDVETELLNRTTKAVKEICRDIEQNYY